MQFANIWPRTRTLAPSAKEAMPIESILPGCEATIVFHLFGYYNDSLVRLLNRAAVVFVFPTLS